VIIGKHAVRQADLLEIAHTVDALSFGLGLGEGGQKEPRQDGDDGNDNQQLDERKSLRSNFADRIHILFCFLGHATFKNIAPACQHSIRQNLSTADASPRSTQFPQELKAIHGSERKKHAF
jgi:hypothetical protein